MARFFAVRWVLLAAAAVGVASCLFSRTTTRRAVATAVCAAGWLALSRWKIRSVDRDVLGIPPRR